jgi:hypothetical protein
MSNQITITNGAFQDAQGNKLALGKIVLQLSNDAVATAVNQQVTANVPIVITLDSGGNIPASTKIWSNAELTPVGTSYTVTAFTASGAQAWLTAQNWVFTQAGGSTVDVGTLIPVGSSVSYAGVVVLGPTATQTITGFGLIVPYLGSSSTPLADSGVIRLANADFIKWRNAANSGNHSISLNASDQLQTGAAGLLFNGTTPKILLGGITSSFPMLKQTGAVLNVRLADDSADANVTAASIKLSSSSAITFHATPALSTNSLISDFDDSTLLLQGGSTASFISSIGIGGLSSGTPGFVFTVPSGIAATLNNSKNLTVQNIINAVTGFQVNGAATSGNVLRGNGTNFVNTTLAAADLSNGVTGTGAVVLANAPTFTANPTFASVTGTGAVVLASAPTFTSNPVFASSIGSGAVVLAASPTITGTLTASLISAKRVAAHAGTALAITDFVASGGWGTSPTLVMVGGTDQAASLNITAKVTTGANPTLTLTFKDGTWTTAPIVVTSRNDIVASTAAPSTLITNEWAVTSVTATQAVFTFIGTPVANNVYNLTFICIGT